MENPETAAPEVVPEPVATPKPKAERKPKATALPNAVVGNAGTPSTGVREPEVEKIGTTTKVTF